MFRIRTGFPFASTQLTTTLQTVFSFSIFDFYILFIILDPPDFVKAGRSDNQQILIKDVTVKKCPYETTHLKAEREYTTFILTLRLFLLDDLFSAKYSLKNRRAFYFVM